MDVEKARVQNILTVYEKKGSRTYLTSIVLGARPEG